MKFSSFAALGYAMGVREKAPKKTAATKCSSCGTPMRNVPGTNVFVCEGKNEKGEVCGHTFCKPITHQPQPCV